VNILFIDSLSASFPYGIADNPRRVVTETTIDQFSGDPPRYFR